MRQRTKLLGCLSAASLLLLVAIAPAFPPNPDAVAQSNTYPIGGEITLPAAHLRTIEPGLRLPIDLPLVMTCEGGWPNNVFLTPDLMPFFAGSYFPPEEA